MTGAGAPGAAGIIKCFKQDDQIQLYLCDADPNAVGQYLNQGVFFQVPKATDPNFIDKILSYSIDNQIDVIFPLVTLELFPFAEHKKRFEEKGIKIVISDKKSLDIANNKSRLYEHLTAQKILTPQYRAVKSGDFDSFLAAFEALGYPENPVCVKPSISNGSRGVRIVDATVNPFDLLFNQKPNSLYTTLENLMEILRGSLFPELLVSEVLTGEEFTVDTLVNKGEPVLILPRLRSKMNSGISVEGQFIENQEIIHYTRQIINSLNLHGAIGIQVKRAADGRFKILEINPRIQGTSVAALGVGINLPLFTVKQELGLPFSIPPIAWGTRFSRFYDEVFY